MSTRRGPYERPEGLGRGRKQVYENKGERRYRMRGKFNQYRGRQNGRGSFGRVGFGRGRSGGEAGNIGMMSSTGHVVHMRGLPHHARESDVKQFFAPLTPVSIRMEYGNGSFNGHVDVDFATHATAQEAMQKNGSLIGRSRIELFLQSNPESGNNQGWGGSGGEHNFHGGHGGNFVGGEGNFNNGRNLNFGGGSNNQANMGGFGGQGNQNTGFNNQPLRQEGSFNTQMQGGNFGQAKFFCWHLHP